LKNVETNVLGRWFRAEGFYNDGFGKTTPDTLTPALPESEGICQVTPQETFYILKVCCQAEHARAGMSTVRKHKQTRREMTGHARPNVE
jgi:hypothetical protein